MADESPDRESREGVPGLLSVVVTIVSGGDVLRAFLEALGRQDGDGVPDLEVIVPWDASVADEGAMAADFPDATFLELGPIDTERPKSTAAGQHELYDRRRAAGLAAARGELVAILEDRGIPRHDWAATVARLHRELPNRVIGGAIEGAPTGVLNWAFYVCDFGRYGLPFEQHTAEWVSDVNVSYKRSAVEDTRHLWRERFREPVVHWFLIERGEELILSPEQVVIHHRPRTTLGELLPERFHWGRLFGQIRAQHLPLWKRVLYSLLGPLIPPALIVRHGMTQMRQGRFLRFLQAAPLAFLLLVFWTLGEVVGTVTNRA